MNKLSILFIALCLISCSYAIQLDTKSFLQKQKVFSNVINSDNNPSGEFEGQYKVSKMNQKSDTEWQGTLEYDGPLDTFLSDTNAVVKKLDFHVKIDNNNELTWKISPAGVPYFSLPQDHPFPHEKNVESESQTQNFSVQVPQEGEPFSFAVFNLDGVVVYDTQGQNFVFTEQYVAFGTQVYSELIWGWGQQRGVWQYESGSYTIWNYDNPTNMNQRQPGQQTYGTHPVILQRSNENNAAQQVQTQYFMTYLRTSYGLQMDYEKNNSINIQMSGGPIEMKFFIYSNPQKNIAAYSKYVNGWALHPFWSMGFHLCRWGLENSEQWAQIWEDGNAYNIAFDTLWSDIDYMQNYEDFTISDKYDVEVMDLVTDLKTDEGVHWIPIIDAGVGYVGDSGLTGQDEGLFIQSAKTDESLIGCVWPGPAYFVDFNHPKSNEFWVNGLNNITEVYNAPQPSGIWLDMNDPSSFTDSNGEVTNPDDCVPLDAKKDKKQTEEKSKLQKLFDHFKQYFVKKEENSQDSESNEDWGYPWSPMGDLPLQFKTISTDAIHYNEEDAQYINIEGFQLTEMEFHDLYAFFEQIATRQYLEQHSDIPFIITRSSFAGSGRYTQLWTGDNYASWDQMETSLGDIFNFQIFQIPMAGPDVCGFSGEADPEMCARWYQLGAFYPFFRSHNDNVAADQFPWSFPDYPYVLQSSKASINLRYSLLKWYYTLFVREQPHGVVFKPLFFEYPEDENAQVEAHQALLGNEVMITPILNAGNSENQITDIKVYFPGNEDTKWFRYQEDADLQVANGGDVLDFQVAFDETCPMFIRSGSIISQQTQYLDNDYSLRTRFLNNQFDLVIAFDSNNQAQGTILGVDSYHGKDVKQYCLGEDNNCMLQLSSTLHQNKNQVEISVAGKNNNTNFLVDLEIKNIRILNNGQVVPANVTLNKLNTSYTIGF